MMAFLGTLAGAIGSMILAGAIGRAIANYEMRAEGRKDV